MAAMDSGIRSVPSNVALEEAERFRQPATPAAKYGYADQGRPYVHRLAILLFSLLLLVPNIANTSNPGQGDEVMHIATVHDSLASGSWLYPQLNGFVNFYKPPLLFWLSMGLERTAQFLGVDVGLLGVRFISVLSSALAGLFLFELLRLFGKPSRQALFWTIIYLSSLGVLKFGRLLMFEQIMAAHIMGVVYLFALWMRKGGVLRLASVGLLVGLSYLYKGPLVPIYFLLFLSAWAIMQIYRTAPRFKSLGIDISALGSVSRAALIVGVTTAVGIGLYGYYLLNHPRGAELIAYFVVFENAAKFVDQNQSEWIILQGVLLYTLPWTLLLGAGIWTGLRKRRVLVTPGVQFGQLLLLSFAAVALFHFIPHRKADYYMLPLFGFLVASAALLSGRTGHRRTQWLVAFIAVLAAAVDLYFENYYRAAIPFLIGLFAVFVALRRNERDEHAEELSAWKIAPGALLAGVLPLTLFPVLFPPILNAKDQALLNNARVCVISENPWSALAYRAVIPSSDMTQRHPDLASECAGATYLIEHDPAPIPENYHKVSGYPVWKDLPASQYMQNLAHPSRLQRMRGIYAYNP